MIQKSSLGYPKQIPAGILEFPQDIPYIPNILKIHPQEHPGILNVRIYPALWDIPEGYPEDVFINSLYPSRISIEDLLDYPICGGFPRDVQGICQAYPTCHGTFWEYPADPAFLISPDRIPKKISLICSKIFTTQIHHISDVT